MLVSQSRCGPARVLLKAARRVAKTKALDQPSCSWRRSLASYYYIGALGSENDQIPGLLRGLLSAVSTLPAKSTAGAQDSRGHTTST
jgi:hypothetical protein